MKNKIYYYIILLNLTLTNAIAQQKNSLKGYITDKSNLPVIGALIKVKNTSDATVTDASGKFTLITSENYPLTIVISGFGYKEKEFEVKSYNTEINLKLEDESIEFETVTITARRRKETPIDVPIAVTSIGGAQAEDAGAFNVNRVKELVPTVQLYSSNPRNTTLNIRGIGSTFGLTNDGLDPGVGFYVDGVYYSRPAATAMDFIDIESIEVLKDASSAAIYGSRGANGVILITTKSGKDGKIAVTSKNAKDGSVYLALFNISDNISQKVSVNLSDLGISTSAEVLNMWTGEKSKLSSKEIGADLKPHASVLYQLKSKK